MIYLVELKQKKKSNGFLINTHSFVLFSRQPSKSLPRNEDIFQLYNSLEHKTAIILVCTNKEMSFQAYVYRFTT